MMKYVFVLALLHFCVSAKSDTNLNREIIRRLTVLKEKVIRMWDVKAPAGRTSHKPQKCLGMIIKELGNLLDNVTVHSKDKHYIPELKGNLNALGDHKVDNTCYMKIEQKHEDAFQLYIDFFKRLNRA